MAVTSLMTCPPLAAPAPTVLPTPVEVVVPGVPVDVVVPLRPGASVRVLPPLVLAGAEVPDPAAGLGAGPVVAGAPDAVGKPLLVGVDVPAGPVPGVVPVGAPDEPEPAPVLPPEPVPGPGPVGVPVPTDGPLPVGVAGPAGDVDPVPIAIPAGLLAL